MVSWRVTEPTLKESPILSPPTWGFPSTKPTVICSPESVLVVTTLPPTVTGMLGAAMVPEVKLIADALLMTGTVVGLRVKLPSMWKVAPPTVIDLRAVFCLNL